MRAQAGKATICHYDQEEDTYHPISISENAVDKHIANHGDFRYDVAAGQCCTGDDCSPNEQCVISGDPPIGQCEPIVCEVASSCAAGGALVPCPGVSVNDALLVQDVEGGCACIVRECTTQAVNECDEHSDCPGDEICVSAPNCCPFQKGGDTFCVRPYVA